MIGYLLWFSFKMYNNPLIELIKLKSGRLTKSLHYSYCTKNNLNIIGYSISNVKYFSLSQRKLPVLGVKSSLYQTCNNSILHLSRNIKVGSGNNAFRPFSSRKDLPTLMDFPQVIWPSMFKTVRNWILSNFIIMRYFDNEFNLPDFVVGSKQAVELVSGMISKGDIDSLGGLVTPEVITQVAQSLNTFTFKQRQEFAIKAEDIYFSFPYEVGIMFPNEEKNEGENQSRFVEITMCYHVMLGLRELQESSGMAPSANMGMLPEFYDKIFICNYRFIREFTKGVQDEWTINAINHFKPAVSVQN